MCTSNVVYATYSHAMRFQADYSAETHLSALTNDLPDLLSNWLDRIVSPHRNVWPFFPDRFIMRPSVCGQLGKYIYYTCIISTGLRALWLLIQQLMMFHRSSATDTLLYWLSLFIVRAQHFDNAIRPE